MPKIVYRRVFTLPSVLDSPVYLAVDKVLDSHVLLRVLY